VSPNPRDNPLIVARMMKGAAEVGNSLLNVEAATRDLVKSLGGVPERYFELPPHFAAAYLSSLFIIQSQGSPQTKGV
jgi:hypothetical protein